jgi:hypothetical protein
VAQAATGAAMTRAPLIFAVAETGVIYQEEMM